MSTIFVLLILSLLGYYILHNKNTEIDTFPRDSITMENHTVLHEKKEYLSTENERKLFFALREALNNKYLIHCQTSLIAIVEPIQYSDKSRAWSKRMDFVITNTATKIVAVIELDDSSHKNILKRKRDKYVNEALNPHYPLIRIMREKFYEPKKIAEILEEHGGIQNQFKKQHA